MYKLSQILAHLIIFCLLVTFRAEALRAENLDGKRALQLEEANSSCNSDELNHSVLIECNITQCGHSITTEWPTTREKLVHIYSSRAGARFAQVELDNLNYHEDAITKLLNINTTLSIFTKNNQQNDNKSNRLIRNPTKILGFGATLDANKILNHHGANLDKSYGLILDDLFANSRPIKSDGAKLNILRLLYRVSADQSSFAFGKLLQDIDQHVAHSRNYNTQEAPLKILLDLKPTNQNETKTVYPLEYFLLTTSSVFENLSSIQLWAIALNHNYIARYGNLNPDYYDLIKKSFPSVLLMASTNLIEAPNVEYELATMKPTLIQGLLLNGQQAIPYELVEFLSAKQQLTLVTVGCNRPKTRYYGDWANAQAEAVEILKHLQHGSMGFIENLSVVDVLETGRGSSQDGSLYNLYNMSHQTHFRGPILYATSHFSRYILPGSEPLDTNVFTQPNMFSAHYGAFKTPNNYIVTIVLNNNDHLLPFQLELDDKIVAHTYLEPKSFNTIIMKL